MAAIPAITDEQTRPLHRGRERGLIIAILAALATLTVSTPAGAVVPAGDLIVNGGAERGSAATDEFPCVRTGIVDGQCERDPGGVWRWPVLRNPRRRPDRRR